MNTTTSQDKNHSRFQQILYISSLQAGKQYTTNKLLPRRTGWPALAHFCIVQWAVQVEVGKSGILIVHAMCSMIHFLDQQQQHIILPSFTIYSITDDSEFGTWVGEIREQTKKQAVLLACLCRRKGNHQQTEGRQPIPLLPSPSTSLPFLSLPFHLSFLPAYLLDGCSSEAQFAPSLPLGRFIRQ